MNWTRRRWCAATGAATLAGSSACTRTSAPAARAVSIHRVASYEQGLFDLMRRVLAEHQVEVRGKRVVLKPNLVEFDATTCINTHPLFVHAALEAFRAQGAASVRIAEGPGHRRVTLDLAEESGFFTQIPHFERIFTDLNLDDVTRVTFRRPHSKLRELYLPQTVLGADLLVSLPKLKTHHWVGATLSMKNLFGVVPGAVYGWPKNVLHWAGIAESIADLHSLFPRHFCLVDGIHGMEGNGPIQGTAKHAGVVIAGHSMVAVDATCCRLMGLDPHQIPYLQLAATPEELAPAAIKQIAETIQSAQTDFQLLPEWEHLRRKTT